MINRIQNAKVLAIRNLSDSTYVLRVERNGFDFIPGQCVNIGLKELAVNREYSTYSGLSDDYLEFLVRKVNGGLISNALSSLKPGEAVTLDGAYGLFVLQNPHEKDRRYVFVASGTGIAPFHSFACSYPQIDYKILHGISHMSEAYDNNDYGEGRYFSCVSQEKGGNFDGRVTEYLKSNPVDKDAIYYLCGNSSMINDVYDILRKFDISGSNIITEVFF